MSKSEKSCIVLLVAAWSFAFLTLWKKHDGVLLEIRGQSSLLGEIAGEMRGIRRDLDALQSELDESNRNLEAIHGQVRQLLFAVEGIEAARQ